MRWPYPLLEVGNFLVGHGVSLCNNRYQVDFGVQPTHKLDVNLLQSIQGV